MTVFFVDMTLVSHGRVRPLDARDGNLARDNAGLQGINLRVTIVPCLASIVSKAALYRLAAILGCCGSERTDAPEAMRFGANPNAEKISWTITR